MKLPNGYNETSENYWTYRTDVGIREPIESNKFLLVSWRMAGSEFCKELIRENYPETTIEKYWAKSHIPLHNKLSVDLTKKADTKVFVIISDPREAAMNIVHFDNGLHLHDCDYKTKDSNSTEFLNEVADKQIELINYYTKTFGDNCVVLRYEDAFYNQKRFLNNVSNFLKLEPLGIDDVRKYKWSIHKNVGNFHHFFDKDILDKHHKEYESFYTKWRYPKAGLQHLKYRWHREESTLKNLSDNYKEMLKRNGVTPSDRTEHLYEF